MMETDPQRLAALLDHALEFAKSMVCKRGEFYPFGACLEPSGAIKGIGVFDGREHPPREEMYLLTVQALSAEVQSGAKAIACAADVNIPAAYSPEYPDGIRVLIEAAGYSRFVYLPYARQVGRGFLARISGRLEAKFGQLIPVDVNPTFFPPNGAEPAP